MRIFSSSTVSQLFSDFLFFKKTNKLRFALRPQWYLMRWLLSTCWFHSACSYYTCRHIESGTGVHLFELQKSSLLYIFCLIFFWWLCHSFQRLQGLTRNFLTGYVILFPLSSCCSHWFISFNFSQSHSIGSVIVAILGITYWYIWGTWLPRRKEYRLQREWVKEEDGISRYVFRRVPLRSVVSHSTTTTWVMLKKKEFIWIGFFSIQWKSHTWHKKKKEKNPRVKE